jgi:cysteine desulfurase
MAPARTYLDHNATSPLRPEVLVAVTGALSRVGNPSSVHAEGREARALVERARAQVAALVEARPEDVTFTGSGTEANVTALRPGALRTGRGQPVTRLITSATEHASVLAGHGFPPDRLRTVGVRADGRLDLDQLASTLGEAGGEPALVSVQAANSETGVLQPLAEIAALVHARGALLHSDAVQAAARMPLELHALGLDALTLSGHKLGAPAGVGALVVAPGRAGPDFALIRGGGQESRMRAGTENVAGIVGFGAAAEIALREREAERVRLVRLRAMAEGEIRRLAADAVIFGEATERLPNTCPSRSRGLRPRRR